MIFTSKKILPLALNYAQLPKNISKRPATIEGCFRIPGAYGSA